MLLKGNCLDQLKTLPDCSVDSIVSDPPYELGFMGKGWDASGIAYSTDLWREALRVLKPGGHLLAFGGTRTYHRLAVAIEDAGFEIRDSIHWTYGSGFPKSLDISKVIDKSAGLLQHEGKNFRNVKADTTALTPTIKPSEYVRPDPQSPEAQQWQGWGTALKPSHEPIVVARKPLEGTVAANTLKWGTGGLNIDGTRVGYTATETDNRIGTDFVSNGGDASNNANDNQVPNGHYVQMYKAEGRWPANTIITHTPDCEDTCAEGCPVLELDGQSGERPSGAMKPVKRSTKPMFSVGDELTYETPASTGGASRFFTQTTYTEADWPVFLYYAKASKRERNAGLDLDKFPLRHYTDQNKMGGEKDTMLTGSGNPRDSRKQNFHPTVKPVELMRHLIRLVTPKGGTVLDPFLGSGTTAVAAVLEGMEWVGCELTEDYWPIIEGRVEWARNQAQSLF